MAVDRLTQLRQWLETVEENTYGDVQPASSDASFRRYFRVFSRRDRKHYIVMDAPPDKEDCHPFIHITHLLRQAGVNAPEIFAQDISQGFLLLADLGNTAYLDVLNEKTADALYSDAIDTLIRMQGIEALLPDYDAERLQEEMDLFEIWYLKRHLGVVLSDEQKQALQAVQGRLIDSALEQPQVFVHRDYHSRNLMRVAANNPGVIDYQDAVRGAISYDLVSLFKDCYIEWPREKVEHWLAQYLERLPVNYSITLPELIRWFDFMGVQRHLKVLGIFARLNYRDGKARYLDDLPLTLKYVHDACRRYDELAPLQRLLQETVSAASPVTA